MNKLTITSIALATTLLLSFKAVAQDNPNAVNNSQLTKTRLIIYKKLGSALSESSQTIKDQPITMPDIFLDGDVDVVMAPGETREVKNVRIGGFHSEIFFFDTILEKPDFITFDTDALRVLIPGGTRVDFTLEASNDATLGEHVIRVRYSFHNGGEVLSTEILTVNLTIGEPPEADFRASPREGEAPLTVEFDDRSSGEIDEWDWDFGDGNSSSQRNPEHTYEDPGTYSVKLTVTGPGGSDSRTRSNYITVNEPVAAPVADFRGSPTEGEAPLTVDFDDRSSGDIDSWDWDFGDGNSSSQRNSEHTYEDPGTYTVELTVTGPGGSDSRTRSNYITVNEPVEAPTADFRGSPTEGEAPLTVDFDDRSSGEIDEWDWDFGDGNSSSQRNPEHTYEDPGTYTVVLTVTGPGGSDSRRRSDYITVMEPAEPPTADFSASPTEGQAPLTVQFTDQSSGDISSREWDFGDGQTSSAADPSHTYQEPGTYTVSLTVDNIFGSDTETKQNFIMVTESEGSLNPPRNLTASVSGNSVLLNWDPPADGTTGADTVEIGYDDGSAESILRGNFSGAELAVRFTPESYPVELFALGFLGGGDEIPDTYGVRVYLDPSGDNDGPSGTPVFDGSLQVSRSGANGAFFPEPITVTSGDFYISLRFIGGTTEDFVVGLDTDSDALRSWVTTGGGWQLAKDMGFDGNLVIRGLIEHASGATLAGLSDGRVFGVTQYMKANASTIAKRGYGSDFAYQRELAVGTLATTILQPSGLRAQLQGYNIYRSETTPVEVSTENLLADVGANATEFTDDIEGEGVFHYVVTALYDEGESPRSNEATATIEEVEVTSIAEARSRADGAIVAVEGIVTRSKGRLTWIQDASAGISIVAEEGDFFDAVQTGEISSGDVLRVAGMTVESVGVKEIHDIFEYEVLSRSNLLPNPQMVELAEIARNGEQYESELIQVSNLSIDSDGDRNFRPIKAYDVSDPSQDFGAVKLFILNSDDTDLAFTPIPSETFTFVGILGQFSLSDPTAGYQLVPVDSSDVQEEIVDSVPGPKDAIPTQFSLHQNYPNPFNPETAIEYQLPEASRVKLTIYNVTGQQIATLVDAQQAAGIYSVRWNGQDDAGRDVASGVYLYRLETDDFVQTRKLTFVR